MGSPRHVIVVGAGMGGLGAALDLSIRGYRVTLLEQAAAPGGKMREVAVGDQRVDSGPTVMTMRWIFDDLFAAAGLDFGDRVHLRRAEVLARHRWLDGASLDLFADLEQSVTAIEQMSGAADAAAYRQFVKKSGEIFDTLDASFMRAERPGSLKLLQRLGLAGIPRLLATRPFKTLWNDLRGRFSDPRLVQLFARYATYCGSNPFQAPATLMLIAEAERRGVWTIEGGMQRLADTMAQVTRECGGEIRLDSPVAEIQVTDGKASGVMLADGQVLAADAVVFNGDTQALAEQLLGLAAAPAADLRPAEGFTLSAMTVSGYGRARGYPLAYHTVLFGDDYADEFAAIFERGEVTARPTIYICAQDRADHDASPDKERLFFLMNAPPHHPGGPAPDYEAARMRLSEHLRAHQLDVELEHEVVTTPPAFGQLFPGSRGALYGRPVHGPWASFQRPGSRTAIIGLYVAGGSVHPGAGVPMATQSGRLAAASVAEDLG
ncbi:MAG: 1-hydroxycarotenoid 3,4-desaturase CrtD [Pseudomonadota bacterium]